MSKKININIPNKVKPNLGILFHSYLVRKANETKYVDYSYYDGMEDYWDRVFPGWDDDLDGDTVFPNSKTIVLNPRDFDQSEREDSWCNKKRKRHSGKRARLIGINIPYDGEEDDYNFDDINLNDTDDYDSGIKEIWFYPDYHNKEDRLEFNSVKEFSDYCESMGYIVTDVVMKDISWRYESHCCLYPESKELGFFEIMCGHSYGDMFYEVCDASEL